MGELGQLLRQTREEKGIALEQVANDTRIRARFLEALEEQEYDALPTPGHVHGFLRNYALYLGLDLQEVQALYEAENKESRLVPGIFRPKDIDLAPPRRSVFRASLVLGAVLVLVALVFSGWALWYYGVPAVEPLLKLLTPAPQRTAIAEQTVVAERTADAVSQEATAVSAAQTATQAVAMRTATEAAATPAMAEPTQTPTAAATPTPLPTATSDRPRASPTPTPNPTRTPTVTPTPSPTPVENVTVSIVVIERAWMQATVDGQALPGELLEVGEERTWEGEETIQFVCGNGGGVEVTVNGQKLGTLGRRAEVIDRTWTPQGEVTPTPTAP
jgi:cytoskeleton protein RodZ